jgi:hypothetical protein
MSNYRRVIPRDLFNEASLLKCLGRLVIELERVDHGGAVGFDVEDVEHFDIVQSQDDGSISVANLPFSVRGRKYRLSCPLNSRQPYPLWLSDEDEEIEPIEVLSDDGSLTGEMITFVKGRK